MINVTKTYLPPIEEYQKYLKEIWDSGWITNNGKLLIELEVKLREYLDVKHVEIVTNGTIALMLAIEALELGGEIITTPFSYVATSSSIMWQHCTPVFVDIESKTFGLDPGKIEDKITERTSAILATHIYGLPCQIKEIQAVADSNNLKVIYDGAQAFGTKLDGSSVMGYGDISTVSFHATKLFHSVEGGAVITDSDDLAEKVQQMKAFGHIYDEYYRVGINGKCSEFHAAMGLCNLSRVDEFIEKREAVTQLYKENLSHLPLEYLEIPDNIDYNYSYFPVIFSSEDQLLATKRKLFQSRINTRRYFHPSLNTLSFMNGDSCPVSEDISSRILCLPMYQDLKHGEIEKICDVVSKSFRKTGKPKGVDFTQSPMVSL